MYRKLSLKTLLTVFITLLILTAGTKIYDNTKDTNTLKSVLFELDKNQVTAILLQPRVLNGESIELKKEDDAWQVLANGNTYNGDASVISKLLNQVNGLKPIRLAARSKEKWAKFDLTDSLASVVTLMGHDGELARLHIGKFSYLQAKQAPMMNQKPYYQGPRGTMTTYVRSENEPEVFAVEGFLGSSINRDANAFRNKQLIKTNSSTISKLTFEYPADSSFTMVKNENIWMCDGLPLDSVAVASYLSTLSSLNGNAFTDELPTHFTHKVKIQDDQMNIIEIQAQFEGEHVQLTSTQNKGSVFEEQQDRNFKKLFISKHSLQK